MKLLIADDEPGLRQSLRLLLAEEGFEVAEAADGAALPGPAPPPAAALAHEQQLAQARTLVSQDPKRVAQVVRDWVDQDA